MKNLLVIPFEGSSLSVITNPEHEWLLDSATVALAYGITEAGLRMHKLRHSNELILNKHFIEVEANSLIVNSVTNSDTLHTSVLKTFWTKKGVVRLGFFIKSEQAAKFRDFAEDLVLKGTPTSVAPALPMDYDEALEALLIARKAKKAAELETEKQKALVQELAPDANYTKVVLKSSSTFLPTVVAKELGMSAQALTKILMDKKVLYFTGIYDDAFTNVNFPTKQKVYHLYGKYDGKGYAQHQTEDVLNKNSLKTYTKKTLVWTEKGVKFIHELLNKNLNNSLKPLDE